MDLTGLLVAIIIGAVAGWLAGIIMKSQGSLLRNIILGIVGGFVASLLFGIVGISFGGPIGNIIVSVIGACLLIWLGKMFLK